MKIRFFMFFMASLTLEAFAMEPARDVIHRDGVGKIRLGQQLPREILPKDLEGRYVAGHFADAQAYDAFKLDVPPVIVLLDQGPFQRSGGKGSPNKEVLVKKAVQAVKKGAKVRMIVVESESVRTEEGIGVGKNLSEIRQAYPDVRIWPVPPTFGKDECVAVTGKMPSVHFMFEDCRTAEQGGKIIRVLLFEE